MKLGTPEAAVRACVGLLAQLFHLNESRLAYYLDLYWQVRQAYEKAEEDTEADERRRQLAQELSGCPPEPSIEQQIKAASDAFGNFGAAVADAVGVPPDVLAASSYPLPEELIGPLPPGGVVYEKPKAGTVLSEVLKETPKAEESAEAAESPATPDGFIAMNFSQPPEAQAAKKIPKKEPDRRGNTAAHDAAMFKRQVRDRLSELRSKGVTSADILAAAPKNGPLTQDKLMAILSSRLAPIEAYRVLDGVLCKIEKARG